MIEIVENEKEFVENQKAEMEAAAKYLRKRRGDAFGGDQQYYDTAIACITAALSSSMKEGKKTYEDGLAEAWELARKIICNAEYGGLNTEELEQIFGYSEFDDVLKNYKPQEAAAKIAEWDGKHKIHVNDEVFVEEIDNHGVVFGFRYDDKAAVMFRNGTYGVYGISNLTKTGRIIDIAGLLAQIGQN